MDSLFRRFTPVLLAMAIASPLALTGCQPQPQPQSQAQPQAQSQETVNYNKWEHETNRPHQDLEKRTPDEQKSYSDWKSNHNR